MIDILLYGRTTESGLSITDAFLKRKSRKMISSSGSFFL